MITNYLIYLYSLPKEEQLKQIFILIIFFLIMFIICMILEIIKHKFFDKKNNS